MLSNLIDHRTGNLSTAPTLEAAYDAQSLYEHAKMAEREFSNGFFPADDRTAADSRAAAISRAVQRQEAGDAAYSSTGGCGSGAGSAQPLDASVSYIVGDTYSSLLRLTQCRDTTEMRAALRSYICALEEMYSQI